MPAATRTVVPPEPELLGEAIADAFGLRLEGLERLWRGEEGHKWTGKGADARFLATVLAREDAEALDASLVAIARLAGAGESWLVPPLETSTGGRFATWREYGILLRRFVEGQCFDALAPSGELSRAAGRVLGRLHAVSRPIGLATGVASDAGRSVGEELADTLRFAAAIRAGDPRHATARLLLESRARLESLAETTDTLRRAVEGVAGRWVLTHGNATPSNFILGEDGGATLIDWSTMCLAPAERDLIFFAGPRLDDFLAGYREFASVDALDRDVFDYYLHHWWSEGVTYFGKRLFAGAPDPASDERAAAALRLFVPEPAEKPATQLRVLARALGWSDARSEAPTQGIYVWALSPEYATPPRRSTTRRAGAAHDASDGPPLRILQVSPYASRAWAYGGVPRVVGALVAGLAARGHEVTVVTTDAGDRRARLETTAAERSRSATFAAGGEGYDQRVFRNLSNRLAYDAQFFVPLGMRGYLNRNAGRFDVVHLHAFRNLPSTFAARACTRTGVPFVITPNGTAPLIESRRWAKRIYDLFFQRVALRGAAKLLAVTEAEARDLALLGIARERLERVPNPLDLAEFDAPVPAGRLRERLGIGEAPLVVFLGRLSPRKRLDTLVRAFARLGDPAARLAIVGADMGALDETLRVVRETGLAERVHFPGLVVGRERLEALRDADVVAYATENEIFGLVPFEALLVGTPVVVADDSGCGELVRHTGGGRLVRPGDPLALAAALGEILAAPDDWRREARRAAERVRGELGIPAVSARLEAVYRSVTRSTFPGAHPAAP